MASNLLSVDEIMEEIERNISDKVAPPRIEQINLMDN